MSFAHENDELYLKNRRKILYTVILINEKSDNTVINANWEKCGFKLLDYSENFLESIKLLESFNPDILFTDFNDESEFVLDEIRKKAPLLEIVFFTEKKDFITAKKAVSLNALEYIMKPCNETQFEDALHAIKKKLDKRHSKLEIYKDYLATSLSIEKLPDNISDAIDNFKLKLKSEDFIVINIQNKKPEQFKTLAVFDTVRSVFGKYLNGECLVLKDIITIIISDTALRIKKNMNPMLIAIIQNLEKFNEIKFVIGISNSFSSLDKISKAYIEAKDSLLYSFEEKNEVILFKDIKQEELKADFLESLKNNLEKKIRFENTQNVLGYIETFFNELKKAKTSKLNFYICLLEMVSVCDSLEYDLSFKFSILESIINNRQLDFIKGKIANRCCEICNNFILKRQSGIERIVDQAVMIIEENYKNPDLSLKFLSESLHISINYLCAIMKRIKGTSFVNLLTNVRMEKSKDLLIHTNSRIQEVAYEVGFTDQHYFSYCFRKYFNTTPKEMREKGQRKKV